MVTVSSCHVFFRWSGLQFAVHAEHHAEPQGFVVQTHARHVDPSEGRTQCLGILGVTSRDQPPEKFMLYSPVAFPNGYTICNEVRLYCKIMMNGI